MSGGQTINDAEKTKEQLLDELAELRGRIAGLEGLRESMLDRHMYDAALPGSEDLYRSILNSSPN